MAPAIDLEKIDWNSITDTRSLFESVLAMLKSRDEENVTLRKDIERLREEAEAIAGDHMMLTEMGARIELLEGENEQKGAEIEQKDAEIEQKDAEIEQQASEIEKLRAENAAPPARMRRPAGRPGQDSPPGTADGRAGFAAGGGARRQLGPWPPRIWGSGAAPEGGPGRRWSRRQTPS